LTAIEIIIENQLFSILIFFVLLLHKIRKACFLLLIFLKFTNKLLHPVYFIGNCFYLLIASNALHFAQCFIYIIFFVIIVKSGEF
jgi:hypothetical protein